MPVIGAALSVKSIPAHFDWLLKQQRDLEIQVFFLTVFARRKMEGNGR
ncbi:MULTISPECIES: hypothetical protein [unclassified Bradyrhizobium]|nr:MULTISPECIES: hypothetical protein [unclassified Bradyrhizobium]